MTFQEWYEEFEADLKEDFVDDELSGQECKDIIHDEFIDEVCDEIKEEEFRTYCIEKHSEWEEDQKRKSQ